MGSSGRDASRSPAPSLPSAGEAPRLHGSPAVEHVSAEDLRRHVLEARLSEIEAKLTRATVFYGVRRLTREGYRRYVASLRDEHAKLVAERRDLRGRDPEAGRSR